MPRCKSQIVTRIALAFGGRLWYGKAPEAPVLLPWREFVMSLSSPFENVHERMGAVFAEYDGWRLPKDFGDPAGEEAALANGAAAFDLTSFGRIAVKGEGSGYIVQSLAGADPELPADDHWSWVADGEETPLRVCSLRGSYLLLTPPWRRTQIMEKVQALVARSPGASVTDMTEKTAMLALYGPNAFAALARILPFDLTGLDPGTLRQMSFLMISITLLRGAWTQTDGLELICPAAAAPMAAAAIAKYQQRENIVPAGMDCLLQAIRRPS